MQQFFLQVFHKLNIEVGRYNKTPRNERFCKKCNTDEIEDEMHFFLLCKLSLINLPTVLSIEIFSLFIKKINLFSQLSVWKFLTSPATKSKIFFLSVSRSSNRK
jgi:hypothetical protein